MERSTATRPHRRSAVLLGAAAGALLTAQAALPAYPSDTTGQVAVAAAHRGAETLSAVAFLVAGVLMVLGIAGTGRPALARGRALTQWGLVLSAIGGLWPIAGRASFDAVLVAVTAGADRSVAVAAVHAVSTDPVFAIFLPLLGAFVLGPTVLALGLRRAGALPIWPAVLWVGGVLTVNAGEDASRVVATAGMVSVAIALGWIGRSLSAVGAPDMEGQAGAGRDARSSVGPIRSAKLPA